MKHDIQKKFTEQQHAMLSNERYGFSLYATPQELQAIVADTQTQELFVAAIDGNAAAIIAHTTGKHSTSIENTHRIVFDLPPVRRVAMTFQQNEDMAAKPVMIADDRLRQFVRTRQVLRHQKPVDLMEINDFIQNEIIDSDQGRGEAGRRNHISANYILFM